MYGAFRQLAKQSGESRPHKDRNLGAAELGRDDGWLLQPGLRSADLSQRLAAGKESCCEPQGFNRESLTPKAEHSGPATTQYEDCSWRPDHPRRGLCIFHGSGWSPTEETPPCH